MRPRPRRRPATADRMHPDSAAQDLIVGVTRVLAAVRDRAMVKIRRHDAVDLEVVAKLRATGLLAADETVEDTDSLRSLVETAGEEVSRSSTRAVQEVSGIPIDAVRLESWDSDARPAIAEWVGAIVERIVTVAEDLKGDLEQMIAESFSGGERAEDLADRIAERFGVSESDAARIAVTETLQLNNSLNVERFGDLGITRGTWTCADPCPICDERDGEVFVMAEADPQPGSMHPFCRCFFAPIVDEEEAREAA